VLGATVQHLVSRDLCTAVLDGCDEAIFSRCLRVVICHWLFVIDNLSLVTCNWLFVIGYLSLIICHWLLDAVYGDKILRYKMLIKRYVSRARKGHSSS
jgi:hypothetical protein